MWNLNGKIWYSEEEYKLAIGVLEEYNNDTDNNEEISKEIMITEGTYTTPDGTEYKLGKNLKLKGGHIIGLIDNDNPAYYMLICNNGVFIEKVEYEKAGEFGKLLTSLEYIVKGSEE